MTAIGGNLGLFLGYSCINILIWFAEMAKACYSKKVHRKNWSPISFSQIKENLLTYWAWVGVINNLAEILQNNQDYLLKWCSKWTLFLFTNGQLLMYNVEMSLVILSKYYTQPTLVYQLYTHLSCYPTIIHSWFEYSRGGANQQGMQSPTLRSPSGAQGGG